MFVSSVSFFAFAYICLSREIFSLASSYICLFVRLFLSCFILFVCLSVGFVSLPSLFRYVQLCACFLRLYSLVESARPYVLPSDGTEEIA